MDEALRGGGRGIQHDAAAYVRLSAGAFDGRAELVQLGGAPPLPLWQVVYWCLRCDDVGAAVA
eukprot:7072983-Prymnesium_polylepis.1